MYTLEPAVIGFTRNVIWTSSRGPSVVTALLPLVVLNVVVESWVPWTKCFIVSFKKKCPERVWDPVTWRDEKKWIFLVEDPEYHMGMREPPWERKPRMAPYYERCWMVHITKGQWEILPGLYLYESFCLFIKRQIGYWILENTAGRKFFSLIFFVIYRRLSGMWELYSKH